MMVNILSNKHNKHYQKHLTLLNREDIEKLLKAGFKFYQIAENIQKDPTTISKEVKNIELNIFLLISITKIIIVRIKGFVLLKTYVILIAIANVVVVENAIPFVPNSS